MEVANCHYHSYFCLTIDWGGFGLCFWFLGVLGGFTGRGGEDVLSASVSPAEPIAALHCTVRGLKTQLSFAQAMSLL